MFLLSLLFCTCALLILYGYMGYPLVAGTLFDRCAAKLNTSNAMDASVGVLNVPDSVSVVIAAYNEESCIDQRIQNLLAQHPRPEAYEILIGSDGSTDQTKTILEAYSGHDIVKAFHFEENRGKASVLNDLVAKASGEIIVFSDANTHFAAETVHQLLQPFTSNKVGIVCGELDIQANSSQENSDSQLWSLERFLKEKESSINGMVGANGGNYAIRRSLYQAIPSSTICDDFLIAMKIMDAGYQCTYQPLAMATEEEPAGVKDEFWRRVRIGQGNFHALAVLWPNLLSGSGINLFTLTSHKILRWLTPHLALVCFFTNLILIDIHSLFIFTMWGQVLLYLFGVVAWFKIPVVSKLPGVKQLGYLVVLNAALLLGWFRYASGTTKGNWKRTER